MNWDLFDETTDKDVFVGKLNISEGYRRKRFPIELKLDYESGMKAYYKDEIERHSKDNVLLDGVYSSLSDEQVEFIKYEIEQSEGGVDFKIISDMPSWKPEWRKGYSKPLMQVWVDQSVGHCEDDYYGYVYIEIIPDKKYLKWYYSM